MKQLSLIDLIRDSGRFCLENFFPFRIIDNLEFAVHCVIGYWTFLTIGHVFSHKQELIRQGFIL